MSTDGPDQRPAHRPRRRDRGGRAQRRPRRGARRAPRRGRGRAPRADGRGVRPDPDRPGLQLGRRPSGSTTAPAPAWRPRSLDPAHPFATAAIEPHADVRSRGDRAGRHDLHRRLPAARRVAAAASSRRSARSGLGWPAPHALDATERETLQALASLAAVAVDRVAARVDRRRALRVVRADGPHRPADRARQRADGRPRPRARARPGRPARAARSRSRSSTSTTSGRRTETAGTRPATTCCAGSRRSSPSRSGWSTRSAGSAATSSSSSRPGSAGLTVARRVLDGDRGAAARSAGAPMSVSAGVARFPADGDGRRGAHRGRDGRRSQRPAGERPRHGRSGDRAGRLSPRRRAGRRPTRPSRRVSRRRSRRPSRRPAPSAPWRPARLERQRETMPRRGRQAGWP